MKKLPVSDLKASIELVFGAMLSGLILTPFLLLLLAPLCFDRLWKMPNWLLACHAAVGIALIYAPASLGLRRLVMVLRYLGLWAVSFVALHFFDISSYWVRLAFLTLSGCFFVLSAIDLLRQVTRQPGSGPCIQQSDELRR